MDDADLVVQYAEAIVRLEDVKIRAAEFAAPVRLLPWADGPPGE